MWSSNVLEKMMTSSMYTRHVFHFYRIRIRSKALWKQAGALIRPNGIRVHLKGSAWHTNAVLDLSSSRFRIFQYPEYGSNVVKYCEFPRSRYIHPFAAVDRYPSWSLSTTCCNQYKTTTFRPPLVRTGLGWSIPTWLVR